MHLKHQDDHLLVLIDYCYNRKIKSVRMFSDSSVPSDDP